MNALRSFAQFWYDFIIGDDWRVAAAVALGLLGTALLTMLGWSAWWLLPLVVVGFVLISANGKARR